MAPLQLNTNVPPYNDDYDSLKNYYKVLFKPGFPVQARELTAIQSILQDQIETLATRILKTGDQVTGGEFGFTNKKAYVRVSSITQGSHAADFVGYTLTGEVSGVVAKVEFAYDQVKNDQGKVTEDVTFQVEYLDAGAKTTDSTFREGEVLTSSNPAAYTATVGIDGISRPIDTRPMGFGSNFTVESGSYFVDGFMVRNDAETLCIEKYSQVPSCQIGFLVNESFVTSNDDPSLLDNSQGSSNFAAPGADRLQIKMQLHKLPLDAKAPNFIGLVDIVQGNLQGKPDQSVKWAWLYDLLAQRTVEEEGDYIIKDFEIKRLEYVNSVNVDGLYNADDEGLYPAVPGTLASERGERLTLEEAQAIYVLEVSAGKAMVQGYQVGYNDSIYLFGNKPRDPQLSSNALTYISPGASFTLQNVSGCPDLQNIVGDGESVAFTPLLMYKQFLDGYVGIATREITYPNGDVVKAPINRNKKPLNTYHIIGDKDIGETNLTEIFREGQSVVVESPTPIYRGDIIGGATVMIVTKVDAVPTGFVNPRYFEPQQVINEQTGFEGYTSTYSMGLLRSTFFTEILCFPGLNPDKDWEIGSRIIGEVSGTSAILEAVAPAKIDLPDSASDANKALTGVVLIVSNAIGDFLNGETIEQPQTNKTATIARPGEVVGFDFYNSGEVNTNVLSGETELEVSALGATLKLEVGSDKDFVVEDYEILLTQTGRDKLVKFPYDVDVDRNVVKVNLTVKTQPSGIEGYGIVLPAQITHTLQKTKSLFSPLLDTNNFASDISIQNTNDAEYISVADGSLFSGLPKQNWVTCDNFSGDASDELVAGDIVSFSADDTSIITKVVKFVTQPAGAGEFRDKCFIYFTTQLEKQVTGKNVQRVRIRTKGDVNQPVVYRLPEVFVKSLESNPAKTGINYQCARQFYVNEIKGSTSVTLSTQRPNESFLVNQRTTVVIARNMSDPSDAKGFLGRLVSIGSISPDENNKKLTITFSEPLPIGATLKIITSVYVSDAQAKRKIIRKDHIVRIPYPESAGTILSLGKADIFQVNYVKSVSTGKFITRNYELDDGQRQNIYDIGRLLLKKNAPRVFQSSEQNESGTIEISIDYFEHDDEGDFFSVDSYTHDDGINYDLIPFFPYQAAGAADPSRQNLALNTPLRDCIDFRPIINTDADMGKESVIAQITPGVSSYESTNFRDTNNQGDGFAPRMPLANSQFKADIEFYVGKIDTLFCDKGGSLRIVEGLQTENPVRPADLATGLRLYDLRIQPFCLTARDNIKLKKYDYFRYGMKEIHGIDKRLQRIEEVVTLSLLEQKALNMSIKDAVTGLDRFSSGYIVDGFNDHSRGDVNNENYRCAIDAKRSLLRPSFFKDQIELEEKYFTDEGRLVNGNYVNNNGICTIPYEEVVYAENPVATRWINLQVYNTFTWSGILRMNPSIDTYTDITRLDDLQIEDTSLFDAMQAMSESLYELGVLGTVWESNQTLIDEYAPWNSAAHRDLENRIASMSDAFTRRVTTNREILPPRTVGTGNAVEVTTQIFGTHITATGDLQVDRQQSIEGGMSVPTSYGDRITDIHLVKHLRTIPVAFRVDNVKPNTTFYAFFDGVPVSEWVSPDEPTIPGPTGTVSGGDTSALICTGQPGSNQKGFGQPIISCAQGKISGIFLIPAGRPPLKQITQKTDDDTGEIDAVIIEAAGANLPASQTLYTSIKGDGTGGVIEFVTDLSGTITSASIQARGKDYTNANVLLGNGNLFSDPALTTAVVTPANATGALEVVMASEVLVNQTFDGYLANVQYELSGPTRSFPTGDRVLRFTTEINNRDADVTDSELVDSFAQATFTGKGIVADRQRTTVSTRNVEFTSQRVELQREINEIREIRDTQRTFNYFTVFTDDPVAQSFMVDANHENGIFVTELECFFRTKDDVVPVEAYLVPTEGHFPVHSIIPMSHVSKNSDSLLRVVCTLEGQTETVFSGTQVTGQTSGAIGIVKGNVVFESDDDNPEQNTGNYVYDVFLSNYNGEFVAGEEIKFSQNPMSLSTFNIAQDEIKPIRVDVTDMGEDYMDAFVTFSQPELPGGVAATANVKFSQGKVYEIEITNPGSGYVNVPSVTIGSSSGEKAVARVRTQKDRPAVEMGVSISDDGTAGTKFKFDAPIYLLGNQTYAFVLYSPSLEYTAFTSKLGESELNTNVRVVTQPHLGSLYKSQNNGIWTEEQTQDIKFRIKKCDFFTDTNSKVEMNNAPITHHKINSDPIETNANPGTSGSKIFGDSPYIVTVYHDWNGLVSGDVVEISGVTGNPGGIPNEEYNQLHTVVASDYRKFTIELSDFAKTTEKAGGLNVFCSYNRPFEACTLKTGIIQPATTSLTTNIRTVGAETPYTPVRGTNNEDGTPNGYGFEEAYTRDTPVQFTPERRFYFNEPKQVASSINEAEYNDTFHLRGEPSLRVTANLTTTNKDLSPIIDMTRTNMYVERNLCDKPDPSNIIFGVAPKTVTFSSNFDTSTFEVGDEVEFTTDGVAYTARISDINGNTGRLALSGKDAPYLNKTSTFTNDVLSALSIEKTSIQTAIDFVPETKNFGSTFSKWMSRQFELVNVCDGVELRMAAVFFDPTDIKVYYKPRAVGFDGDFDNVSWIPFNASQPAPNEDRKIDQNGNIITPLDPEYENSTNLEFVPTPGLCNDVAAINVRANKLATPEILKNTDLFEMKWSFQDAAKFDAIALKIVITAANPAKCPLIDDIRVVCSE